MRESSRPPVLAYVEHCLPGEPAERLRLARAHDLALEVANRQDLDVDRLRRSGVAVCTVQAWKMHELHPLHADPEARRGAQAHVRRTIEIATRLRAPRVLTVCGYGEIIVDAPFERCRDFFGGLVPFAREHGVRLLVEPLGRGRAAAMTDPDEVERLLEEVGAEDVLGLAIDTGHLLDDGHDPGVILAVRRRPVEELQLRGRGSAPPSVTLPLERWIAALPVPPAVVAVEHREPIAATELAGLLSVLRAAVHSRRKRGGSG